MFTPFLSPWKAEERRESARVLQETYSCSLEGRDLDKEDRDILEDGPGLCVPSRTGDLGEKAPLLGITRQSTG